ncbi:MAG: STAS domain-containing protein [Spirochaetales bacterium]|nr:STAS domain-containing protein [Spirochaetales bacterium]
MSINKIEKDGAVVLEIDAESLIKDEAMLLKKTATEIIDEGQTRLRLDLSRTKFIDSSGIGKLLFLNKKLEQCGGSLEIIAINNKLYDFLDSLAITRVIKIVNPN